MHHPRRMLATIGAVGAVIALILGVALWGVGLGRTPVVHAGSGGPGDTKYVLKVSEYTVLAAYQIVDADGYTITEVSITAGQDISRQVPAPSTKYGPAALAVVTRYNQLTGETLFAGAGFTDQDVAVSIDKSLNSATVTANVPIASFDAPPDSPPAFFVTMDDLTFMATGPAVHTVQSSHFNMHGANTVQTLNGARAPATTTGTVIIGDFGTVTAANLLNCEIDDYHSGTTSVSKG